MLNSISDRAMASRPPGGVIIGGLRATSSLYEKRKIDNCKSWVFFGRGARRPLRPL
jgi:hypothetical protein